MSNNQTPEPEDNWVLITKSLTFVYLLQEGVLAVLGVHLSNYKDHKIWPNLNYQLVVKTTV